ncbi:MAG TPA: metallopeptidase TldD-related protein [Terracidiphilus sp.]|nr:metallopeptidase TldD-related protein [Terracidiphilus sp.]
MNLARHISPFLVAGLLSFATIAPHPASAQTTRADAAKDPVLKAMLDELDRSMTHLQLSGFEKPYFIEYRMEDVQDFESRAMFGDTEGSHHGHARIARITVRVGDYKTDNSGLRGDGAIQLASIDDDPIALRSALWAGTDQAYKAALAAYAQKQAELKQVQTPPQADDFSKAKPIVSLAEPLKLSVDENAWSDRVARDSGIYRTDPALTGDQQGVQYSTAAFHARVTTTWIASSEGAIVRKSSSSYSESIGVGTQADDGMHLDRSYGTSGASLSDLDSPEDFHKHALTLISSLSDLRKAPLVEEEYHGPVLLSADASADTLHSLLAPGVTATRPKLGTEARTNGPFASSYKARIMPDFLSVVDDPALRTWEGKYLVGSYSVDDEAVPAQTVQLVSDGHLQNYLIGRTPVRDFPESNGHARAGVTGPARPAIGVLKVTAQQGLTDEELNSKLVQLAKDRGLKSVYYVETLGAENTPRLLYRIDLDGKRTLVRGAVLDDLDQRALRSGVVAAGKNLWVANYATEVPETVLAPALLFDDITVKRANETNDKLPYYPAPE